MNLNLDTAKKELVIKALTKYRTRKEACVALGVSKPTLRKMVNRFSINERP